MRAVLLCCAVAALASHAGALASIGEIYPPGSDWLGLTRPDPSVQQMDFSYMFIQAIPRDAFKNMPNVEAMDLSFNNLADNIEVGAFAYVLRLRKLYLKYANISVLPTGVFAPVTALEELNLSGNSFKELPSTLFEGLTSLEEINLGNNQEELKIQSRAFANLPSLQNIGLMNNSITSLPHDMFSNSTKLRLLFLSFNNIRDIPEHLFSDLKNLYKLWLDGNKIDKLDNSVFCGLNNLKELYLDNNRITFLEPTVFNGVPNLELLELSHNSLTISETQGVYPPTEEYLATQYNQEFRTDEGLYSPFQNLRHIKHLHLSYNNISVMCTDWRSSRSLRDLDLSRNIIHHLSEEDMHFRSTVNVNLIYNRIRSLDLYVYDTDRSIPSFHLNHNPYHCSCSLLPFVRKYSLINNTDTRLPTLHINEAVCIEPPHLRYKSLKELTAVSVGNCF